MFLPVVCYVFSMKILDVGCGTNKHEGAIGLDNNPKTAADVIHDLGTLPYPFPDNEFDTVVSNHVVEHVPDLMAFISRAVPDYQTRRPDKIDHAALHESRLGERSDPSQSH